LQRDDDRANTANELSLANVGGVFVVLLAGMGLACLIAVAEFVWKSRRLTTAPGQSQPEQHEDDVSVLHVMQLSQMLDTICFNEAGAGFRPSFGTGYLNSHFQTK
jgi:hypothetical protein